VLEIDSREPVMQETWVEDFDVITKPPIDPLVIGGIAVAIIGSIVIPLYLHYRPRKESTSAHDSVDSLRDRGTEILVRKDEIEQNQKKYNIRRIVGMLCTTKRAYASLRQFAENYQGETTDQKLDIVVNSSNSIKTNFEAWKKAILEDFAEISGLIKNAMLRDKLGVKLMLIHEPAIAGARKHYPYYHNGEVYKFIEAVDTAIQEIDRLVEDFNEEIK
ncbi:MAG: hypothetical protein ACREBU_22805, partial [Nitrososphaera sp.]